MPRQPFQAKNGQKLKLESDGYLDNKCMETNSKALKFLRLSLSLSHSIFFPTSVRDIYLLPR
jgi:hypothetical protein